MKKKLIASVIGFGMMLGLCSAPAYAIEPPKPVQAFIEAAEKTAGDAANVVANGVEKLENIGGQIGKVLFGPEIGETKVEQIDTFRYDIYISHSLLFSAQLSSTDAVRNIVIPIVKSSFTMLPKIAGDAAGFITDVTCDLLDQNLEKLLKKDKGHGVIVHVDLLNLRSLEDITSCTDAQKSKNGIDLPAKLSFIFTD